VYGTSYWKSRNCHWELKGIGRAIAERLGKDGASVVVNYVRNADKSREVVSAIEAAREGAHSPCGPT
jgi:NAD(P)-dependent dehydrogenase (short-subunit alcohol dehydrogenase family)